MCVWGVCAGSTGEEGPPKGPSPPAAGDDWDGGSSRCMRLKFEVTVGSALGPLNSYLLKAYADSSPLLPPLARLVRRWAQCRGLVGAAAAASAARGPFSRAPAQERGPL